MSLLDRCFEFYWNAPRWVSVSALLSFNPVVGGLGLTWEIGQNVLTGKRWIDLCFMVLTLNVSVCLPNPHRGRVDCGNASPCTVCGGKVIFR